MHKIVQSILFLISMTAAGAAWAGEADIVDVKVAKQGADTYQFEVTLRHADTGWNHYADAFIVVGPAGKQLGKRVLFHPHVNEQPFTRSLSDVKIPPDIKEVTIRAHDSVHELGGKEMQVNLPDH